MSTLQTAQDISLLELILYTIKLLMSMKKYVIMTSQSVFPCRCPTTATSQIHVLADMLFIIILKSINGS